MDSLPSSGLLLSVWLQGGTVFVFSHQVPTATLWCGGIISSILQMRGRDLPEDSLLLSSEAGIGCSSFLYHVIGFPSVNNS